MNRRLYTPPTAIHEDVFEQTSLACNATAPYDGQEGGGTFWEVACRIPVAKGGNYTDAGDPDVPVCDIIIPDTEGLSVVVLS